MLSKLQYYISMLHGIRTKGSEYILVDSDRCNNDVAFPVTSEIVWRRIVRQYTNNECL